MADIKALLKKLEWAPIGIKYYCQICNNLQERGHKENCELKTAIETYDNSLVVEVKRLRRELAILKSKPLEGGREKFSSPISAVLIKNTPN